MPGAKLVAISSFESRIQASDGIGGVPRSPALLQERGLRPTMMQPEIYRELRRAARKPSVSGELREELAQALFDPL